MSEWLCWCSGRRGLRGFSDACRNRDGLPLIFASSLNHTTNSLTPFKYISLFYVLWHLTYPGCSTLNVFIKRVVLNTAVVWRLDVCIWTDYIKEPLNYNTLLKRRLLLHWIVQLMTEMRFNVLFCFFHLNIRRYFFVACKHAFIAPLQKMVCSSVEIIKIFLVQSSHHTLSVHLKISNIITSRENCFFPPRKMGF